MQKIVYEYAIIRAVPKVEREEFINVGVIVYCKKLNHLEVKIKVDENKLRCLDPDADLFLFTKYLEAFNNIAHGLPKAGPIAQLDEGSRFRWLTAKRSTMIQCSPIHSGLRTEEEKVLDRLFEKMISSS